jgi:hypothetical protein
MKQTKNVLVIAVLLITALSITTCNRKKTADNQFILTGYNRVLNQWKAERKALAIKYQNALTELQRENIVLKEETQYKKNGLEIARKKAFSLEQQLKNILASSDSTVLGKASINTAYEYFEAQSAKDTACDQIINSIESQLVNRDSAIVLKDSLLGNFRDLQKEQELQTNLLTEELNTAYKIQKKKRIQNKWLACGMVFVSGIVTTVLIKQKLK